MAPILHVANPRASTEWYAKLGFEVESGHAFGPDWPLYVRLRRGPAQLRLSEHRLEGGPVTHAYLYVEDVDSSIPAGTAVEDCPWGMREAKLTDPDLWLAPYLAQARCTGLPRGQGAVCVDAGVLEAPAPS